MKLNYIGQLVAGISLSLACQGAFALAPCPTAAKIKVVPATEALMNDGRIAYTAGCINDFQSGRLWAFGISNIVAADNATAITNANTVLTTLAGTPPPIKIQGITTCLYTIGSGYTAKAVLVIEEP